MKSNQFIKDRERQETLKRFGVGYKKCSACLEVKKQEFFGLQNKAVDGLKHCCKKCKNSTESIARKQRRKNDAYRVRQNKYYNGQGYKLKYGLDKDQVDALIERQGNICKICLSPPTGRWKRLVVDHDHKTGEIRGLICGRGNSALGLFSDKIESILSAVSYLQEAENRKFEIDCT